jgi:hypothetical protein
MGEETRRAEEFARELVGVFGEDVRSVVLYGSAARGDFTEGVSDLNLLVLLRRIEPEFIRRASALARGWAEQGNPPPLLLSEHELQRSLDIFAIEYSDIREAHRVLYGDDPFADLEIRREHLRLQCERELKAALIQLRERYLLVAEEPAELAQLLRRSVSTFLVLFRTVLRLSDQTVPPEPNAVVEAVAARAGFEAEPLLAVLRERRSADWRPAADDPIVAGYVDAVAQTVTYVDRLPAAVAE